MPRPPRPRDRFPYRPLRTSARRAGVLAPLVWVLVLLLDTSAWALPAAPRPEASAETSAYVDVFVKKGCAKCHRVPGFPHGTGGPDLSHIRSGTGFFDIGAAMWNHLLRMRAQMLVQNVEWPVLTPQQLESVIAFLFASQDQDVAGDPPAGARLFVSKGCAQCHATGTDGSGTGPPLRELKASRSPVVLAAIMWNHASRMAEARAAGVRHTFAGSELADVMAYILSAAGESRGQTIPALVGVPERGEQVFEEKGCAKCHAVGGKPSARGPSLGPRPKRATVIDLAGALWNHGSTVGSDVMPHTRVSGQEMAELIAYLHASHYFDTARGNATRGQRLLREKGCLRCHSIYSKGGGVAPDLATSNVVGSDSGQVAAMWNHGRQMENWARRRTLRLPMLTAQQLADITRYLAGLGGGPPRPE